MRFAHPILSSLLFICASTLAAAEPAKPVNPNTWIKASTDHPDAQYKVGEKVVFSVSLADKAPSTPTELEWKLTLDGAKVLKQGTLKLVDGKATVEGTLDSPGVLQLKVTPTKDAATLGVGLAGAAIDPYKIEPTAKLPKDFKEFWGTQTAGLSRIPLDPKVTPVDQPNPNIELYEVSFANIDGRRSTATSPSRKGQPPCPS
jgi:hypothetical protein